MSKPPYRDIHRRLPSFSLGATLVWQLPAPLAVASLARSDVQLLLDAIKRSLGYTVLLGLLDNVYGLHRASFQPFLQELPRFLPSGMATADSRHCFIGGHIDMLRIPDDERRVDVDAKLRIMPHLSYAHAIAQCLGIPREVVLSLYEQFAVLVFGVVEHGIDMSRGGDVGDGV